VYFCGAKVRLFATEHIVQLIERIVGFTLPEGKTKTGMVERNTFLD
jgi:hypothetical protein